MNAATTPSCPPWSLHAWEPVFWQVDRLSSLRLRHLATHVTQRRRSEADSAGTEDWTRGHTMWAGHSEHGDAAIAWDWFYDDERSVVALRDPFGIVTNLRFVDRCGHVLTAYHAALPLSQLVHQLPWHAEVLRQTRGEEPVLALAA